MVSGIDALPITNPSELLNIHVLLHMPSLVNTTASWQHHLKGVEIKAKIIQQNQNNIQQIKYYSRRSVVVVDLQTQHISR
jgi:hypothetical protein